MKLEEKLAERNANGNLRRLTVSEGLADFFSNDYLGLSRNKELGNLIHEEWMNAGETHVNGATGSRLLSGNSNYYLNTEKELAQLFGTESSLLCNSGYTANTSLLSSVPQKGDTIIYDELIHASLKEGARLSFASRFSFRHNDLQDLERKLQKATGDAFVVIESVYSMDGDFGPIEAVAAMCEKYKAYLIVDEAHSTGIFGESGKGLVAELRLEKSVFARVHTFGKAMGVHGACICGSRVLTDFLINFARPFIYTTALPLHSVAAIRTAFRYLSEHPELQQRIHERIRLFRSCASSLQGLIPSESPIQALRVGGNERTRALAKRLMRQGYDVRPILSPTVKEGEERLRICVHEYNTEQEIKGLAEAISASVNI